VSEIKLTPDQQVAVDAICDFLDSGYDIFTLSGIAGAGKTTCIREAIKFRSNVIGATISHSAKFVLQESLQGTGASCFTIAQLLGLKQEIDEEGKIRFIPRGTQRERLPIANAGVLIIDECSMIDENTYRRLMSMKNDSCKVIMMGDVFQLPPVEEGVDSVVFDFTKATLNEAVRYTGPIADLGNRIRTEIQKCNEDKPATRHFINGWMTDELDYNERTSLVDENGSGIIFLNDIDIAVDIAVDAFKNNEDPNAMRLLAFRNSSIKKINSVIRTQIYCDGDEDKMDDILEFMPGELVICDGGYNVIPAYYHENERPIPVQAIYNNQTFKVVNTVEIAKGPSNIPSLGMVLDPSPNDHGAGIYSLDYENGRHMYYDIHNEMRDTAKKATQDKDPMARNLWRQYYAFKAQWAWFDYAYAQNCYKAQGRTFQDVIVFENDIFNIKKSTLKAKLQAMYVSCTRAKRRVYIYNDRYRVNQDELPEELKKELGL